jgi:hypothetical protein
MSFSNYPYGSYPDAQDYNQGSSYLDTPATFNPTGYGMIPYGTSGYGGYPYASKPALAPGYEYGGGYSSGLTPALSSTSGPYLHSEYDFAGYSPEPSDSPAYFHNPDTGYNSGYNTGYNTAYDGAGYGGYGGYGGYNQSSYDLPSESPAPYYSSMESPYPGNTGDLPLQYDTPALQNIARLLNNP